MKLINTTFVSFLACYAIISTISVGFLLQPKMYIGLYSHSAWMCVGLSQIYVRCHQIAMPTIMADFDQKTTVGESRLTRTPNYDRIEQWSLRDI